MYVNTTSYPAFINMKSEVDLRKRTDILAFPYREDGGVLFYLAVYNPDQRLYHLSGKSYNTYEDAFIALTNAPGLVAGLYRHNPPGAAIDQDGHYYRVIQTSNQRYSFTFLAIMQNYRGWAVAYLSLDEALAA